MHKRSPKQEDAGDAKIILSLICLDLDWSGQSEQTSSLIPKAEAVKSTELTELNGTTKRVGSVRHANRGKYPTLPRLSK